MVPRLIQIQNARLQDTPCSDKIVQHFLVGNCMSCTHDFFHMFLHDISYMARGRRARNNSVIVGRFSSDK